MSNKEPLISIVITYYKKKKFIKKTINSIFMQNYKNYEIIFVYDDDDKNDLKYLRDLLRPFKIKLPSIFILLRSSSLKLKKYFTFIFFKLCSQIF